MMVFLTNKAQLFSNDDFLKSYFNAKEADCALYSADGEQFQIHKEILCQTKFMQNILFSVDKFCCKNIEIFCPCPAEDLKQIVNFMYSGKITHDRPGTSYMDIQTCPDQIFGQYDVV